LNREGDGLLAKFRSDKVRGPEGWEEILLPEIGRDHGMGKAVAFRDAAAFAILEMYQALEERGVKYAIRVPANDSLQRDIAELIPRPVGEAQQEAAGQVRVVSLLGGELEEGAPGGCEGRTSCGRSFSREWVSS
jgi:hypothetical protein